jgi:hypothetical protein
MVEISQNITRGMITKTLDRPAFSSVRLKLGLAWGSPLLSCNHADSRKGMRIQLPTTSRSMHRRSFVNSTLAFLETSPQPVH